MKTGMTDAGLKTGVPNQASASPKRSERRSSDRRLQKRVYLRGRLPHINEPGLTQFITFRLADAVPAKVVEEWRNQLRINDETHLVESNHAVLWKRIAQYEDAGHGACHLRDFRIGCLVEQAILHFHGAHYHCLAWCIMPNHVHVIIRTFPGHPLAKVIKSWKAWSARQINVLLGRDGIFWARGYFDRIIRDKKHLVEAIRYIEENPVKAGLCERAKDWPLSSARHHKTLDNAGLKTGVPTQKHLALANHAPATAGLKTGAPNMAATLPEKTERRSSDRRQHTRHLDRRLAVIR